jgi:pimeloyl-ACP methyl ester carboxylesterase
MNFRLLAGFLVATLFCGMSFNGAAFAAQHSTHHTVHVDGHPVAVWSKAPRNPRHVILLVHGRTWSALPDFDLQVSEHRSVMDSFVNRGYATYAIDLRGYGATPRNSDGWTTPNQSANDVAQVLRWVAQRHPSLNKPALLGWSNGAVVSHLTAQLFPDTFSDLILLGYPRDPGAALVVPPTPASPPRETNTRERAKSDFISPQVTSQSLIDAYVGAALKADPVRTDWNRLEEFRALSPSQIKNPTLVIHGERDPLAPIAAQSRLFVGLGNPDKQWVVLPGGDHAALLEDTHEAFIAAVVGFVERPRLRP